MDASNHFILNIYWQYPAASPWPDKDRFARLWAENMRVAPVGRRRSLDLMLGFVRLLQANETIRQPSPDYSQLTDEELNHLIAASLAADAANHNPGILKQTC